MHKIKTDNVFLKAVCEPQLPDEVTLRMLIMRALHKFGGVHGSAIPVDILVIKSDPLSVYSTAYLKCPSPDFEIVLGALGGASYEEYCLRITETSVALPLMN